MKRINGGINSLIKMVNSTFGFDIGLLQETDISFGGKDIKEWKKGLESWTPTSDKDVVEFFKMNGEYNPNAYEDGQDLAKNMFSNIPALPDPNSKEKDLPGKFGNGFGKDLIPKTPPAPPIPTAPAPTNMNNMSNLNKINNIGQVDKIGDVDGTVDVTSEDLKLMRELAEMQAIQRFVSLTPTVQVTTGDINSGHDVDSIISKITEEMNSQIVSSAQGVYG